VKEFAEFEPSFWLEDGMVVETHFQVFRTLGSRTAALFAAVAFTVGSIVGVGDLSVSVPAQSVAAAQSPPLEVRPFTTDARPERGDRDVVTPGYWHAARLALGSLPVLPAESPEPDDEPLI
jgi:hypothetical protein